MNPFQNLIISFFIAFCFSFSQAKSSVKKTKTSIIEMEISFEITFDKCIASAYEYGSAIVNCVFEIGEASENGQFNDLSVSEEYFNTEFAISDGKLYLSFIRRSWIDDVEDVNPKAFFNEIKSRYASNPLVFYAAYYGPDFKINNLGNPL